MSLGGVDVDAAQLPEAFAAADTAAGNAQAAARFLTGVELLLLVAAAVTGVVSWRVSSHRLDVLAALGTLAFVASLAVAARRHQTRPQAQWIQARGAAESIKSAAWCYAVSGAPFPPEHPRPDGALVNQVELALAETPDVALPAPSGGAQITFWMRSTRAADFESRREIYTSLRVDDQIRFYADNAARHDRRRSLWLRVGLAASSAGVLAGVLRFVDILSFDLLGPASAIAAGALAWTELNQSRTLAAAYSVTARQLGLVRDRVTEVTEREWPDYVRSAENLMAREHSIWLADRGALGPFRAR